MTNEELSGFAGRWPGTAMRIGWDADLVRRVGGRMSGAADATRDAAPSLEMAPRRVRELSGRPGFAPAPYLARAGRVQARPGRLAHAQPRAMLRTRAERVRAPSRRPRREPAN